MTGQRAKLKTTFLLTASDFDRLQAMVESPRYRATHPGALMKVKELLDDCEVVAPIDVPEDVVTMRSRIVVRDSISAETQEYALVYPDESDIEKGMLSVLAPMGLALLGKRAGESVMFEAPLGSRRIKVVSIDYQPESAGDLHL
jgi:regulator of nucleoside diphosphate kinase